MTAIPTRPRVISTGNAERYRLAREIVVASGRGVKIANINAYLARSGRRPIRMPTFLRLYEDVYGILPAMAQCQGGGAAIGPTDRLRLLGYAVPTSASSVEERARSLVEIDAADRLGVMIRFVLAVEAIGGASRARRYLDAIERAENAKRSAAIDGMVVVAAVDDAANTNGVPPAGRGDKEE